MYSLMETPLWQMTGAEFLELQKMALKGQAVEESKVEHTQKRYVYGLRGIKELFGVSHATAQKLKDGVLKPAVKQHCRTIVIDADLAMELFNGRRNKA